MIQYLLLSSLYQKKKKKKIQRFRISKKQRNGVSWKIPSFRLPGLRLSPMSPPQSWSFSLPLIKSLSPIRGLIARDETESIRRPIGLHYERWPSWMPNRRRDSVCPRNANELPMRTFDGQPDRLQSFLQIPPPLSSFHQGRSPEISPESRSLSRRSRADSMNTPR